MNSTLTPISPASRARLHNLSADSTRHFLDIARGGMHGGARASRGEASAFQLLAKLLPTAAKLGDIDASAREGFTHLLLALADPDAEAQARSLLPRVKL